MNLMARRRMMAETGDKGPLYSIDGVYNQTNGVTELTITGSHWHMVHTSSGGNGVISNLLTLPRFEFYNVEHTYRAEVENLVIYSGSPVFPIVFGFHYTTNLQPSNMLIWLWQVADGNGTFEQTFTYQRSNADPVLGLNLNWAAPFELEFDFRFYIDGIWYC